MRREATISECGKYRYTLTRSWKKGNKVIFIGLNPSTADGTLDDATIRKLKGFTYRWGYTGFIILNLFAIRSRNPTVISVLQQRKGDPIGPENIEYLKQFANMEDYAKVVFMWGDKVPRAYTDWVSTVRKIFRKKSRKIWCFGITQKGNPRHPLMLSYETELRKLC
jgi:hypothetical protein